GRSRDGRARQRELAAGRAARHRADPQAPATGRPVGRARGKGRMRSRAAIVALAVGWALIMQSLGWAQTSYYAFVKALSHGTARIDAYHWETRDKSYINGHFYSVKAPGLAFVLTPP